MASSTTIQPCSWKKRDIASLPASRYFDPIARPSLDTSSTYHSRNRFQDARSRDAPRCARRIAADGSEEGAAERRPATISDVARRARVSPATVSRRLQRHDAPSHRQGGPRSRGRGRARLRAVRPRSCPAPAAGRASGRSSSPTSRTRSSRRSSAASRTSPTPKGYRLVLCNSDEDLAKEAGVHRHRHPRADGRRRHRRRLDHRVARRPPASTRASRSWPSTAALDGPRASTPSLVDNRLGARAGHRAPARRRVPAHRVHRRPGADVARRTSASTATATRSPTPASRFDRTLVRRADFREDGGYKATRDAARAATNRPTRCSSPTT